MHTHREATYYQPWRRCLFCSQQAARRAALLPRWLPSAGRNIPRRFRHVCARLWCLNQKQLDRKTHAPLYVRKGTRAHKHAETDNMHIKQLDWCMHTSTQAHKHTCTHAYMHTCIHAYKYSRAHALGTKLAMRISALSLLPLAAANKAAPGC